MIGKPLPPEVGNFFVDTAAAAQQVNIAAEHLEQLRRASFDIGQLGSDQWYCLEFPQDATTAPLKVTWRGAGSSYYDVSVPATSVVLGKELIAAEPVYPFTQKPLSKLYPSEPNTSPTRRAPLIQQRNSDVFIGLTQEDILSGRLTIVDKRQATQLVDIGVVLGFESLKSLAQTDIDRRYPR